jgi:hypothetical protein
MVTLSTILPSVQIAVTFMLALEVAQMKKELNEWAKSNEDLEEIGEPALYQILPVK